MKSKKNYLTLIILFLFAITALLALAGPAAPAAQADSGLPTRDRPAKSSEDSDDKENPPLGGYIVLQAQPAQSGLWGIVQWKNSAGNWENVEGWQGMLNNGHARWWVAAKDFGDGPFQWVVKRSQGGEVIGASAPFHLPSGANETVFATATVK